MRLGGLATAIGLWLLWCILTLGFSFLSILCLTCKSIPGVLQGADEWLWVVSASALVSCNETGASEGKGLQHSKLEIVKCIECAGSSIGERAGPSEGFMWLPVAKNASPWLCKTAVSKSSSKFQKGSGRRWDEARLEQRRLNWGSSGEGTSRNLHPQLEQHLEPQPINPWLYLHEKNQSLASLGHEASTGVIQGFLSSIVMPRLAKKLTSQTYVFTTTANVLMNCLFPAAVIIYLDATSLVVAHLRVKCAGERSKA